MRPMCFFIIVWLASGVCRAGGIPAAAGGGPGAGLIVDESTDMGALPAPAGIRGRDGGYSAMFGDRSVWIYGDTIVGRAGRQPAQVLSNSWSWTRDRDASDGIGPFVQHRGPDGLPMALFAFTEAERRFNAAHAPGACRSGPCGNRWALWPGAVIADPAANRLIVFYEKIAAGPGVLNFSPVGHSVAVWEHLEARPERPVFHPAQDHPTLMFREDEPGFGSAAVRVGTVLYVYACDRRGHRMPCRVARVDMDRVLDRDRWAVYTAGDRWHRDLNRGRAVFDGNGILSVSFNPYLGRYLAVYSRPMSTAVMLRTAPHPQGPWSEPVEAFSAEPPANDIGWIYDALEHPEYRQDDGRLIYITYSRQTGDVSFEIRLVAVWIRKGN